MACPLEAGHNKQGDAVMQHFSVAPVIHAAIEQLLESVFSMGPCRCYIHVHAAIEQLLEAVFSMGPCRCYIWRIETKPYMDSTVFYSKLPTRPLVREGATK
jgi:hypothetical protein